MNQFLEFVNDDNAQQLVGGKAWGKSWGLDKGYLAKQKNNQNVFTPIRSSAVSTANAIAINISIFSINSPQIATATAISGATSIVEGGSVSA